MSKKKNSEIEFDRDLSPIDNKIKKKKYEEEDLKKENLEQSLYGNPNKIDINDVKNETKKNNLVDSKIDLIKEENFNSIPPQENDKKYEEIGVNIDFIPEIISKEKEKLNEMFIKKEKEYIKTIEDLKVNYLKKENELKNNIKEIQNSLNNERSINLTTINKLRDELNIKEINLKKISETNEGLRKNLKKLSEQVNNLFNQITKQKQFIKKLNEKNANMETKEKNVIEEQLKMKEIQLKSTQNLMEVLTKENKSLKEKLDKYGDYDTKIQLLDSVKYKDSEILNLLQEKKDLKKQLEEHKKCEIKMKNNTKEIEDITNKMLKFKDKYLKLKNDYDILLAKDKQKLEKDDMKNKNILNKNCNHTMFENKNTRNNIPENGIFNFYQKRFKNNFKLNENNNLISNKIHKLNPSRSTNDLKTRVNYKFSYSLFSDEEKKAISTLFSNQEDLDNFNKKISIIESNKSKKEILLKSNIKKLNAELSNKEEQINYLQTRNKENEIRLIISINKINESNNINTHLKKKINEQKGLIDSMIKDIKSKREENKIMNDKLRNLISEMKSIKELNEKQRSKSHSELSKKRGITQLKNDLKFSDINIDVNALKKENEELSENLRKKNIENYSSDNIIEKKKRKKKMNIISFKTVENKDKNESNENNENNENIENIENKEIKENNGIYENNEEIEYKKKKKKKGKKKLKKKKLEAIGVQLNNSNDISNQNINDEGTTELKTQKENEENNLL